MITSLEIAAQEVLRGEILLPEAQKRQEIIQIYRGCPLELKIVSPTIKELFASSIDRFLLQNTIVLGDLHQLLAQQFEPLSDL